MIPLNVYLARIGGACESARIWVGNKTAAQAWRECQRADWMIWLLRQLAPNDRRLRLAAADFAERVWPLIDDEPTKLSAAWAIGATRRGDQEEMVAASFAPSIAPYAVSPSYYYAADAAAYAVADAAADAAAGAADAAAYAVAAAYAAAAAALIAAAAYAALIAAERAAQADILREYFPANEIARMVLAAIKAERPERPAARPASKPAGGPADFNDGIPF